MKLYLFHSLKWNILTNNRATENNYTTVYDFIIYYNDVQYKKYCKNLKTH